MDGKRVDMTITRKKAKRRIGWPKERGKNSSERPVQEAASKIWWWRADPEDLNYEEAVKLHDKFVQVHNVICNLMAERLAGSSSDIAAPEKLPLWEEKERGKREEKSE